jgi:lysophospholipase L1-like esterase
MAAKEVSNECSSHISVNSMGNSDITYCKNCMEYEIQLKEALDELSSTQMINKLLQKELLSLMTTSNTWRKDPNPPILTRNSGVNSEWTLVTEKNRKLKAKNKRDINEKVIKEQFIKTTNRFIPLTKTSEGDTPVIVNGVSRSTPVKMVQKGKPKITVIGDSFARGMAGELAHELGSTFEVRGHVMTGAGMKTITESAEQDVSTLTKKDIVVVWGATNDITRNEAKNALTNITDFVKLREHTNVLLVGVPTRFDLLLTSCVNREVTSYNKKLYKQMKQFEQVRLIDSEPQRKYYTQHGMHMNRAGKERMAHRIAEAIKEVLSKKETSTIPLPWKQETDRSTAITGKGNEGSNMNASAEDKERDQTLRIGRDNGNCNSNSNNDTSKSESFSAGTVDSSENKATLPKRQKRYIKNKNEDFLWF